MNNTTAPPPAAPTHPVWAALDTTQPLYGVADGAANDYIHAHLKVHEVAHIALYQHDDLPQAHAPWLFPLQPQETFSEWYLQTGLTHCWGVLLATPLPLAELAQHLKSFLIVQDEQGQLQLMRWYDPRVIKAYLVALSDPQRSDFFKPGLQLWADAPGQQQTLLHYQQDHHHYRRTAIDLSAIDLSAADTSGNDAC